MLPKRVPRQRFLYFTHSNLPLHEATFQSLGQAFTIVLTWFKCIFAAYLVLCHAVFIIMQIFLQCGMDNVFEVLSELSAVVVVFAGSIWVGMTVVQCLSSNSTRQKEQMCLSALRPLCHARVTRQSFRGVLSTTCHCSFLFWTFVVHFHDAQCVAFIGYGWPGYPVAAWIMRWWRLCHGNHLTTKQKCCFVPVLLGGNCGRL